MNLDYIKSTLTFSRKTVPPLLSLAGGCFIGTNMYDKPIPVALLTILGGASLYTSIKICDWTIQKIGSSQLDEICRKIMLCDATRELFEEAEYELYRNYGINLSFKSIPNFQSESDWSGETGEIRLSSNLSKIKMQECIIFELANSTQSQKFHEINLKGGDRRLGEEDYIYQMVRVEWESARIAKSVTEKAKKQQGNDWNGVDVNDNIKKLIELPDDAARWEWSKMNLSGYINHYRNQYQVMGRETIWHIPGRYIPSYKKVKIRASHGNHKLTVSDAREFVKKIKDNPDYLEDPDYSAYPYYSYYFLPSNYLYDESDSSEDSD